MSEFSLPNGFGGICEKVLSDPYVLFLVTVAMFFKRSKIPTSVLCRIFQETFILSLVQIVQVVSEIKSFEKLLTTTTYDDGRQKRYLVAIFGSLMMLTGNQFMNQI